MHPIDMYLYMIFDAFHRMSHKTLQSPRLDCIQYLHQNTHSIHPIDMHRYTFLSVHHNQMDKTLSQPYPLNRYPPPNMFATHPTDNPLRNNDALHHTIRRAHLHCHLVHIALPSDTLPMHPTLG